MSAVIKKNKIKICKNNLSTTLGRDLSISHFFLLQEKKELKIKLPLGICVV